MALAGTAPYANLPTEAPSTSGFAAYKSVVVNLWHERCGGLSKGLPLLASVVYDDQLFSPREAFGVYL